MKTLLQLKTSLFSNGGESSRLADAFVDTRKIVEPGLRVVTRDLAKDPVPHLTGEGFQGFIAKPEARTPGQAKIVAYSDSLIDEFRRADTIVIGLPMYNFGVPSTLKAYFDHIARAGVTFKYTDKGPVGLLTGKKVYVISTRGGVYAGGHLDSETTYVRDFLAFLGITDVEFIYAEGLAMGEAPRKAGLEKAHAIISGMNQLAAA
ncbi:MAG TPA: NAD(P)H-dependent oxidoreductase [Burkholderiales bacterium]|nr:NAD(P)H-dependent oxidoreductase [Burkholderiales bacterium]